MSDMYTSESAYISVRMSVYVFNISTHTFKCEDEVEFTTNSRLCGLVVSFLLMKSFVFQDTLQSFDEQNHKMNLEERWHWCSYLKILFVPGNSELAS